MAKVNKLIDAYAGRAWATGEKMAEAASDLIIHARALDIEPEVITITPGVDFEETGEYELILWGRLN